ncbi:MAG: hypothetical protein GY886_12765, partial [Gammaproteobacteria bacterium]|nr:hypothetical protein [Gammaproteobacteria bacterium]
NTSFNVGLTNWWRIYTSGKSSVNWSSGAALLTPEKKQTGGEAAGVSQLVAIPVGTENEDRLISFTSFMSSGSAPSDMIISIGTTAGGNDIFEQEFKVDNAEITYNPNGATSYWITFSCVNNVALGAVPPQALLTVLGTRSLTSVTSSRTGSGAVEFSHPWDGDDIRSMQTEMSPNEFSMYFLCQDKEPQKLSYDIDTDTWAFSAVAFNGKPTSWITGNYPTTLTFFQGRSWWAGVQSEPQTFWGSKSNDESTVENELEDLTTGTEANDGLEFSLSKAGRIRWMEGGGNLVIGTNAGEFLINGSQGLI